MSWQSVLINLGIALGGIVATFGVRTAIAWFSAKDYYDKHLRVVERLGFRERRVVVREGLTINVAEGPGTGVPLLLIPGQGSVWQEYCKALPGLGDSVGGRRPRSRRGAPR